MLERRTENKAGKDSGVFLCRRHVCWRYFFWILFLGLASRGFAQETAPPSATPQQSDVAAPASAKGLKQRPAEESASQADSAKKFGQITLDVTVTDKAGLPVSGLDESDFAVLDNQQPAMVLSFHAVNGGAAADSTQAILVIDEVNDSFQSVATERDQIVKFLSGNGGQLPIPIALALFSGSGVKIDQPTRDGHLLISELEKMPIPVHTITEAMGGEGVVERYQLSLKMLNQLLTYTESKPGRKLLLWIGPGWPMMVGASFASTPTDKHANWDEIVSSSRALREARTTLYSINSSSSGTDLAENELYKNFLKPVTVEKDTSSGNLALPVLALRSGGKALNGSNDLAGGIASCIADASDYYTITIQTTTSETVNSYQPLEVKLQKAGLTARTNAGHYNQPYIEQPPSDQATLAPATLRTQVRLVVLDAVVLDKKGAPVTGLKAGDFVLKEDGVAQKLASVEEHRGAEPGAGSAHPAAQDLSSASATSGTTSASNQPIKAPATWNVLLVDQFNTAPSDQAFMLKQLKKFVTQLPAGEPVALVVMTSQIKLLSPFQGGAAAISGILDKNGLPPGNSSPPADIYARGEELEIQHGADPAGPNAAALTNKGRVDVERQGERAQATLDNFSTIAKWLSRYPGRKNVYWLTAGFPLQGQPFGVLGYTQTAPTGPANHDGQALPIQAKTDKELESARVAIYPIDAHGVAPPDINGVTTADNGGDFLAVGKLGDKSIDFKKDDQFKTAQQSEMLEIAKATGGVATFNNDIAKTLRTDFARSDSYYTISYTPSNNEWNGGYRRMNLALDQPGYQLIYRQGYYAKDPQPQLAPTKEEFRQALGHGAATATDVLFSASVSKAEDAAKGNSATVNYKIDARTIAYQADASGKLAAALDCAIVEYDSAGKAIATSVVRLNSTVDPARRTALNADGIRATQSIALKPGAMSLTLGIRDQTTGRFGNLEVALPAVAQSGSASATPAAQPAGAPSVATRSPAPAGTDSQPATASSEPAPSTAKTSPGPALRNPPILSSSAKQTDDYHELKEQIAKPGLAARTNTGFYNQA
jgi:VWFA-related protein